VAGLTPGIAPKTGMTLAASFGTLGRVKAAFG